MNNDKTRKEGSGANAFQLRGRKRLALVAAIVVAAALVATGAVALIMNDLGDQEIVGNRTGASVSTDAPTAAAGESTGSAGQGATTDTEEPAAGEAGRPEATQGNQGNGDGFEPGQPPPVAAPVAIDRSAAFNEPMRAEVTKIEAVDGEANGPGEIGGPALRVSLKLTNGAPREFQLGSSVVALYFGADDTPAAELSGPGAERFAGTLGAGESASGVYVFAVPQDMRDQVRITVSYSPTDTAVAFEGSAP